MFNFEFKTGEGNRGNHTSLSQEVAIQTIKKRDLWRAMMTYHMKGCGIKKKKLKNNQVDNPLKTNSLHTTFRNKSIKKIIRCTALKIQIVTVLVK